MKSTIRLTKALVAVLLAACATTAGEREMVRHPDDLRAQREATRERLQSQKAAAAKEPPPPFDARAYASQFTNLNECESGARLLKETSADEGWAVLLACSEKHTFSNIRLLLAGAWDEELRSRPEAGRLITRVVSLRGGDVDGDLDLVQRKKIPLFSLSAAMKSPDVYKGRLLVMRAKLSDFRTKENVHTAMLTERSIRAQTREVETGTKYKYTRESSAKASGEYETTDYGSGRGSAEYSGKSEARSTKLKDMHENVQVDTGRAALGRLAEPDPFLEPDKDYIFLVRFEGLRQTSTQGENPVALVSVMGYFAPNKFIVE
jgi:hypothetical protein